MISVLPGKGTLQSCPALPTHPARLCPPMQENGAFHFLLQGRAGAVQPQTGFRHGGQPLPLWWGSPTAGKTGFLIEKSHRVSTLASSVYGQDFPCPQHPTTYNTSQSKQPHPRQPPPMATSTTHGNLLMTSFINGITYLGHSPPRAAPRRTYSIIP